MDIEISELCEKIRCEIRKVVGNGDYLYLNIAYDEDTSELRMTGEVCSWHAKQLLIAAALKSCGLNGYANGNSLPAKVHNIDVSKVVVV